MAKQFGSGKEMGIKIFQLTGMMEACNNQTSPFSRHRERQAGPTCYGFESA
ncbi:MAG: hypothetical protein ABJ000_03985 [Saccharospirillum sp.]|uniref:hypothetical protein n=1 Tax=Saccharospirillum sp. TaxID=2033801 RepID=UPI00329973A3